jgi:aspartate racemase
MKKKIGILGGISLASTIQYYKTITDLYYEKFKDYYYPEIIIYSLDFQYFTDLENEHKTEEYINYILSGINHLKNAGADFIIMAANSPHSVFDKVKQEISIPLLSIIDCVAKVAKERNLKKVLLTGIKYTMESNFYQDGLKQYGIDVIVPNNSDMNTINNIIFTELVLNIINVESKNLYKNIISNYDIDGVILGCTELPLLLNQNDTNLIVLDSLKLHCEKTLEFALNMQL